MANEHGNDQMREAAEAAVPSGYPAPKRKKRTKLVVLGVVVVVILAAGGGFWAWHEQPAFCDAICHTPMDPYRPTYGADPGAAAEDKWGNGVSNASAMLSATHRVEAGSTCLSCHIAVIGEQVSEGVSWVTGSYDVHDNEAYGAALEEKTLTQLTAARGSDADSFCLNGSCHDVTRADLVEMTSHLAFNPHISQHGEIECGECHKAHRASVLYCTECHENAQVPSGWLSYDEDVALRS